MKNWVDRVAILGEFPYATLLKLRMDLWLPSLKLKGDLEPIVPPFPANVRQPIAACAGRLLAPDCFGRMAYVRQHFRCRENDIFREGQLIAHRDTT
jgi:hypothetical protein